MRLGLVHTLGVFGSAALAIGLTQPAFAALSNLDGSGFGVPSGIVNYDASAPSSNFGTGPVTGTNGAAYTVSVGSDATDAYILVKETGDAAKAAGLFSNLYLGVGSNAFSGANLGFEITNNRAFVPGVSGYFSFPSGIQEVTLDLGADAGGGEDSGIEIAIPFSYFETDPSGIGFTTTNAANPDIVVRDSQSFGYTYSANFDTDRLGVIVDPIGTAVPEPLSLAVLGSGILAIGFVRRLRG